MPWLSLAAVARDWNAPVSRGGMRTPRRYDLGFAVRPFSTDFVEVGFQGELYDTGAAVPRATLAIEIPRLGKVRGELAILDPSKDKNFTATAGLEVNLGRYQLSGGGIFGDAYTKSGGGFYAGAAVRGFREAGAPLPSHVVRIRISSTPGVRAHTRLLRRLWHLADDRETDGVLLVVRAEPAASLANAEELADAIDLLRARGKKVVCHLEDAGGRALYACAHANRTVMNPAGGLRYAGVHVQYYYFGGLLKKLGVRADFVRIGAHKLAAEEITSSGGSNLAELDHQELIDEFAAYYERDVADGQADERRRLQGTNRQGPLRRERGARRRPRRSARLRRRDRSGDDRGDGPPREPHRRPGDDARRRRAGASPDKIGVVYLHGNMIDGESEFIPDRQPQVRRLEHHRQGAPPDARGREREGGRLPDRDRRRLVARGRRHPPRGDPPRPSQAARRLDGLDRGERGILRGRRGSGDLRQPGHGHRLDRDLLRQGRRHRPARQVRRPERALPLRRPRADAESFFRPFTDDERRELGHKVKQFYDLFIGRVAEGRHLRPEAVDAIARGRIWTGKQASERGLVDKLGGLRQALAEARFLGGLPKDAPIVEGPDEDDSILGFLLHAAGITSIMGDAKVAELMIPPELLSVARALAPFMVFDGNKPLALSEVVEDTAASKEEP